MGTWGVGPFEDDTALDFIDELKSKPTWSTVTMCLEQATSENNSHLPYVDAVKAIAASAVVAAAFGWKCIEIDEISEIIEIIGTPSKETVALAINVIERIEEGESDLKDLVEESGEAAGWKAELGQIKLALAACKET